MKPLLFIIAVIVLGIIIALQFGKEVTWFNYYAGAVAGLLISGAAMGYWSHRKTLKDLEEAQKKKRPINLPR
jgi:hypothetical protein